MASSLVPVEEPALRNSTKRFIGWTLIAATTLIAAWMVRNSRRPHAARIRAEDVSRAIVPPSLDGTHPCVFAAVEKGNLHTQLGRCATPVSSYIEADRFEADLRYGSFVLRQTDLAVANGAPVPLTRTYTSQDWGSPSHDHAFGLNSTHNWDIAPTGTRRPYTYLNLMLPDSDFLHFERISAGTGFADAVYMHTETSTPFYKATIAWNGDGWTLRRPDGSAMYFPEAYASKNLAQGAACLVKDEAGRVIHLQRDKERNLEEIRTEHGHWIRISYDGDARITQAEDDAGEFVRYGYNNDGLLAWVMRPSGQEQTYEYQGKRMTAVLNEQGTVLVRNEYRSGILIRQDFANGDSYSYDYQPAPSGHFMDSVMVTLPDLSQQQIRVRDTVPAFLRKQ
jgi:YD repeat-containing protein